MQLQKFYINVVFLSIRKNTESLVNFVFINLISPRIDYRTGGKINLELKPFGSIAQDLYNFVNHHVLKAKIKKMAEVEEQIIKNKN